MDSSLLTKLKRHITNKNPLAEHSVNNDILESKINLEQYNNKHIFISVEFESEHQINILCCMGIQHSGSDDSLCMDEIENNTYTDTDELFKKYTYTLEQTNYCVSIIETLLPEFLHIIYEHEKPYKVKRVDFRGIGTDKQGNRRDLEKLCDLSILTM